MAEFGMITVSKRPQRVPKFLQYPSEKNFCEDMRHLLYSMTGAPSKSAKEKVQSLYCQIGMLLDIYRHEHISIELQRMLEEVRYSIVVTNYSGYNFNMRLIFEVNGNTHRLIMNLENPLKLGQQVWMNEASPLDKKDDAKYIVKRILSHDKVLIEMNGFFEFPCMNCYIDEWKQ